MWFCYLRLIIARFVALGFALMSLAVVVGESTLFIDATVSVFPLVLEYRFGEVETQILCLVPLLYIVFSTYVPLFQLKLQGRYGLYSHNHTDPGNMIWSACFMARLIPALSYNFLLLLKVKDTQFVTVMKVVNLVPIIGLQFAEFFPLLLIVLCLLNGFDVHNKIVNCAGLTQFSFTEHLDPGRIVEGQTLLAQARLDRERALREMNSHSARIARERTNRQVSDEARGLIRPLRK